MNAVGWEVGGLWAGRWVEEDAGKKIKKQLVNRENDCLFLCLPVVCLAKNSQRSYILDGKNKKTVNLREQWFLVRGPLTQRELMERFVEERSMYRQMDWVGFYLNIVQVLFIALFLVRGI